MKQIRSVITVVVLALLAACAGQKMNGQASEFTGPSVSCGNLLVFVLNDSSNAYIRVSLDAKKFQLFKTNEFDLEQPGALEVSYVKFDSDVSNILCNDVMPSRAPEIETRENAYEGRVTIMLDDENLLKYHNGETYKVDVKLENVFFHHDEIPVSLMLENQPVGWMPG